MVPKILVISDSDPTGAAGIQADLKAVAAQGAYACPVPTILTARNTKKVAGIHSIPANFLKLQLDTLTEDIEISAIKIGMVPNLETAEVLRDFLITHPNIPVVWDPVLIANDEKLLIDEKTGALIFDILKTPGLVDLATPNLAATAYLLHGEPATTVDEMVLQARALLDEGLPRVLIKGGHLEADATDIFADENGFIPFTTARMTDGELHGIGTSLASAIAALYLESHNWGVAVRDAKQWLTCALEHVEEVERKPGGAINHFYCWW